MALFLLAFIPDIGICVPTIHENVNGDFRFLDRINHFHSHIHFRSMFWAAAAQTVAQCAAACAGDGSMYLIAIYLFAFQVGIMPPGSLHRTRSTTGGFLLWNNGIIYAEKYRLICLSRYRQNGLEALLTLYGFYLFVIPLSFGQKMPIGGSMSHSQFAAVSHFPAVPLLCHSENHFLNASLRNAGQKIQATFIKILAKFFTDCYTTFHKAHLFGLCGWWFFLIVPY